MWNDQTRSLALTLHKKINSKMDKDFSVSPGSLMLPEGRIQETLPDTDIGRDCPHLLLPIIIERNKTGRFGKDQEVYGIFKVVDDLPLLLFNELFLHGVATDKPSGLWTLSSSTSSLGKTPRHAIFPLYLRGCV
ncbi:hypothetical protein STEG23_017365 [Scotinomys teguina]